MKCASTTNWHINRACLHSISEPALESPRNRGFKKLLLEAVDEGLSLLGDSPKQAIYLYLEKTFKIERQDIPSNIEEFTDAIEKIFGLGAKILEIRIMKHLHKKVGPCFEYFPEKDELLFTKYVAAVRVALTYAHVQPFSPTTLV